MFQSFFIAPWRTDALRGFLLPSCRSAVREIEIAVDATVLAMSANLSD